MNRFFLFKWRYRFGNDKERTLFSKIRISEEQRLLTEDYYRAIKKVPQTIFVFDRMIFDRLVHEIQYFHSINMISDEEKAFIKKDLSALLDYLSVVANHGCYPETKNKVNLYLSHLSVDTNYSYTHTRQISICFVHVFDKFEIYSFDTGMVKNFMEWMQQQIRTSHQISVVDEKSMIAFFRTQRQIVDAL